MIRVVHVSDIHYGADPETYVTPVFGGTSSAEIDSLFELAQIASQRKVRSILPAALAAECVVSGDISAHGLICEIKDGLDFIRSRLMPAADTPAVGLRHGRRAHFTLGNHDIWGGAHPFLVWFCADRKKAAAQSHFLGRFPRRWSVLAPGSRGPRDGHLDDGPLRVRAYLLDSTLPGVKNVLARGRVPDEQLSRLEELVKIDAAQDKGKTVLRVAILHHPIDYPSFFTMYLEDADEVRARLDALEFGLVLCGHVHTCDVRQLGGNGLWQIISGSATQTTRDREPNEFFVYDVFPDHGGSCRVDIRRYSRPGTQRAPFSPTADVQIISPRTARP